MKEKNALASCSHAKDHSKINLRVCLLLSQTYYSVLHVNQRSITKYSYRRYLQCNKKLVGTGLKLYIQSDFISGKEQVRNEWKEWHHWCPVADFQVLGQGMIQNTRDYIVG